MHDEFGTLPEALKNCGAETAIVLGSGLSAFTESLEKIAVVPYGEVDTLPVSEVPGHPGRFVVARMGEQRLLICEGRVHLYEGWTAAEAAASVRVLHAIGIKRLILTNAAGTISDYFGPGTWMMLTDHINLMGQSPLHGHPSFLDMSEVYSKRLREIFQQGAAAIGLTLHEGVYAALPGPQYETPAEVRMLRKIEADAVGMSTVPEAIQARALGLEIAAFSCLTNWGAGLGPETLSHDEVLAMGHRAADSFQQLLKAVLPQIV